MGKRKFRETQKREYIQTPETPERGTPCHHCGHEFDHRTTNVMRDERRRLTRRRAICGACGKPFILVRPMVA